MNGDEQLAYAYLRAFGLCSVYLIGPREGRPVKVGYSGDPLIRLHELRVSSHQELILHEQISLLHTHGARALERAAHECLRPWKLRGEWFGVSAATAGEILVGLVAGRVPYLTKKQADEAASKAVGNMHANMDEMQKCGGLKILNRKYKILRTERASNGRATMGYHEWLFLQKRALIEGRAILDRRKIEDGLGLEALLAHVT